MDNKILEYFDFLIGQVFIGVIYFLYVLFWFDVLNFMLGCEVEGMISNYEINDEVVIKMDWEICVWMSMYEGMYVEFDVKEGFLLE